MYKNLIVSGNFLIVIALAVLFMPSSAFCTSVLPDAVQAINSERIHTASNAAGPVLLASKETDKAEISPVDTKAPATTKDTDDADKEIVADPLEPVNRLMFGFNDKLYFWALKPFFSVYWHSRAYLRKGEPRSTGDPGLGPGLQTPTLSGC